MDGSNQLKGILTSSTRWSSSAATWRISTLSRASKSVLHRVPQPRGQRAARQPARSAPHLQFLHGQVSLPCELAQVERYYRNSTRRDAYSPQSRQTHPERICAHQERSWRERDHVRMVDTLLSRSMPAIRSKFEPPRPAPSASTAEPSEAPVERKQRYGGIIAELQRVRSICRR